MASSDDMMELVYISHANKRFSHQDLVDLLTHARVNNESSGVTGMLLYDGFEAFIQAIEGPKANVAGLFEKISKDSRHERISVLWRNDIKTRNFPDWQMGFQDVRELNADNLQGYSDFMQNLDIYTHPSGDITFAKELLKLFKQNNQA